jgi:hypothetical protein
MGRWGRGFSAGGPVDWGRESEVLMVITDGSVAHDARAIQTKQVARFRSIDVRLDKY